MWTTFEKSWKTALFGAGIFCMTQAADAALITFSSTNTTVDEGNTFTLTVVGQDFTAGIGGATANGTLGGGLTLSWDPAVITLGSVADVDLVFPGDQFFGSTVPVALNTGAGTLSFSVASFFGTNQSAFSIADLTFTALAAGASPVGITVSATDVWADGVGAVNVNPSAIGASVTVTGTSTVIPLPAPFVLLLSGLLGIAAIARGRDR